MAYLKRSWSLIVQYNSSALKDSLSATKLTHPEETQPGRAVARERSRYPRGEGVDDFPRGSDGPLRDRRCSDRQHLRGLLRFRYRRLNRPQSLSLIPSGGSI